VRAFLSHPVPTQIALLIAWVHMCMCMFVYREQLEDWLALLRRRDLLSDSDDGQVSLALTVRGATIRMKIRRPLFFLTMPWVGEGVGRRRPWC
jgi:hypothetical protein